MAKNADQPRKAPPKCPKCRWPATHPVSGRPPEPAYATCESCRHRWQVCGAHPDAPAGPCFQRPKAGHKRCHDHGNALSGAPVKHGGRSQLHRALRIDERMEPILSDPTLAYHRANIATIEGLIQRAGEESDQPPARWAEALALCQEAIDGEDGALFALRDLLERGLNGVEREDRVLALMEQQRKHKRDENRREAAAGQTLNARQAYGMIGALVAILTEEISAEFEAMGKAGQEQGVLRRISSRVRRLVSHPDGGPALVGGGGASAADQ